MATPFVPNLMIFVREARLVHNLGLIFDREARLVPNLGLIFGRDARLVQVLSGWGRVLSGWGRVLSGWGRVLSSGTSLVVGDKSCRRGQVLSSGESRARALASNHHGTRGTLSGTRGTLWNYPVSGAAAPSLPSTRAGGQDDGSYTNSLKLLFYLLFYII